MSIWMETLFIAVVSLVSFLVGGFAHWALWKERRYYEQVDREEERERLAVERIADALEARQTLDGEG